MNYIKITPIGPKQGRLFIDGKDYGIITSDDKGIIDRRDEFDDDTWTMIRHFFTTMETDRLYPNLKR